MGLLYGLGGYVGIAVFLYWAARSPRRSKDPVTVECTCGYNLTANETGICPECGKSTDAG